jgi:hypothetical protein
MPCDDRDGLAFSMDFSHVGLSAEQAGGRTSSSKAAVWRRASSARRHRLESHGGPYAAGIAAYQFRLIFSGGGGTAVRLAGTVTG